MKPLRLSKDHFEGQYSVCRLCDPRHGWWVVREPGSGHDRMQFETWEAAHAWLVHRVDSLHRWS